MYKHSILHFRTLYSLARTLPAYALARTLALKRKGLAAGSGADTSRSDQGAPTRDERDSAARGGPRAGPKSRTGAGLAIGIRIHAAGRNNSAASAQTGFARLPAGEGEPDEAIAVDVPLDAGDDKSAAAWTPRGGDGNGSDGADQRKARSRKTTERIVFPGVLTPFG